MKKFLFFLSSGFLVAALTVAPVQKAAAQTSFVSQYGNTIDTSLTGALTKYLTLTSQVSSRYNTVEVQFTATKISGTVAGTVTLQASQDGTDWYTAPGTSAYSLTDGTQTTGFKITDYCASYLRIAVVGSGTMSAQIKGKLRARKTQVQQQP